MKPEVVLFLLLRFPGVALVYVPKMANLAAAVAAAAANRDPAVDRSLRSVFGTFLNVACLAGVPVVII